MDKENEKSTGNLKVGLNKRVCAFLIDLLVLLILEFILLRFGVRKFHDLIWIFYFGFRDSFKGQSIGKMFVGIQVIDKNNIPISYLKSLTRNIFLLLPMIFIPFIVVEYIVMYRDTLGRRIGDMIAKTFVRDLKPAQPDSKYVWISILVFILLIVLISQLAPLIDKAGIINTGIREY